MTSLVHDVHTVPSAFIDRIKDDHHQLSSNEREMVLRLSDAGFSQRDDALEWLKAFVRHQTGNRIPFSDPIAVFRGLAVVLTDPEWDTRYQCVKLIGEIIPLLDSNDVDACMKLVMAPMVRCLGDSKVTLGTAAVNTLSVYADRTTDIQLLVDAVVNHGIETDDAALKKSVVENVPSLFDTDHQRRPNLQPLVSALVDQLAGNGNTEESIMHCLEKISGFVGAVEFDSYLSQLTGMQRGRYSKAREILDTDLDLSLLLVSESSSDTDSSSKSTRSPQLKQHIEQSAIDSSDLEFGVVPSEVVLRVSDHQDLRTLSRGIEDLKRVISCVENVDQLVPHVSDFFTFLSGLLDDDVSFQVIVVTLEILGVVMQKIGSAYAKKHLSQVSSLLTRRMYDMNAMVRKAVMQLAMILMQTTSPMEVVNLLSSNLSHRNVRLRQSTLDVLTAALLTFPSRHFDLPRLCKLVAPALLDQKKVGRHAAMECVAILVQTMGPGKQEALMSIIESLEVDADDASGITLAVQTRLTRRQLPTLLQDGLIEYSLNISTVTSSRGNSADVEWIVHGSASEMSSMRSARSDRTDVSSPTYSIGSDSVSSARRYISAAKSLTRMLPWEKGALESCGGDCGQRTAAKHSNCSTPGENSPTESTGGSNETTATAAGAGRSSAAERRATGRPRPMALSMTWPNTDLFQQSLQQGAVAMRNVAAATSPQLPPPTIAFGGGSAQLSPVSTESVRRGTSNRQGSSTSRRTPPVQLPELVRCNGIPDGAHHDSDLEGAGDSKEEMLNSLRQIRNSATKKQLSKIFDQNRLAEQNVSVTDLASPSDEISGFKNKQNKIRSNESFFDTKPRLLRKNTLLVREREMAEGSAAVRDNSTLDVTVIGKGYGDENQGSGSPRPSKPYKDRRRQLKGSKLSPLSSPSLGSNHFVFDDDRLPSGIVGKAALSPLGNVNATQIGPVDERSTEADDDERHTMERRLSDRTINCPPSGVYGRSVQYESISAVYSVGDDTAEEQKWRSAEQETGNRPRQQRRRESTRQQPASNFTGNLPERQPPMDADQGSQHAFYISSDVDTASESTVTTTEFTSASRRRRKPKKTVEEAPSRTILQPDEDAENPEDCKPYKDAPGKLVEAKKLLGMEEWEWKRNGLNIIRRLAVHHESVLASQLHSVVEAVTVEVKNLRSQVSCLAMVCLAELYKNLHKNMDNELDRTVPVLLKRTGDTNKFIKQNAENALFAMVDNTSSHRALSTLISTGAGHKNTAVRCISALLIQRIVEMLGADYVLREMSDKVLPIAAQFLQDGSQDARYYGQSIFYTLMSHRDFDRQLSRIIPIATFRHIQGKIDTLRNKGLGEPPSGSLSAGLRRIPSEGRGFRGSSAPSLESPLMLTPKVSLSATAAKKLSSAGGRIDDATLSRLAEIETSLAASDWNDRFKGIDMLQELVDENPAAVSNRIAKIFSKFIPCLHDRNAKVNLFALQALEHMTPMLADSGGLSSVIIHMVQVVISNLTSKNPEILDATQAALDAVVDNIDSTILLQPFVSEVHRAKLQLKPDITDRVIQLSRQVGEIGRQSLVTSQVLPLVWHLLGTILSAAGGAGRLRASTANLVGLLSSITNDSLQTAARNNPSVTTPMRLLLDELLDGSAST